MQSKSKEDFFLVCVCVCVGGIIAEMFSAIVWKFIISITCC